MHLSKTIKQNDKKGFAESSMTVEVDYNPDMDTVEIEHVYVFNCKQRIRTEITAMLFMDLPHGLEGILIDIDWKEVFTNTLIDNLIHSHDTK